MKLSSRTNGWCGLSLFRRLALGVVGIISIPTVALATPSTSYWAPSTATCQPKYVPHVTYDTYSRKGPGPFGPAGTSSTSVSAYPIDTGLTMGVLPWNKLQAEVGYDLLLPSTDPVVAFLNGKVCTPESSLFKGSPAISVGFYNVGFHGKTDPVPTNYDTMHLMFQKAFPFGYIAAGLYHGLGADVLYTNSDGKIVRTGAMLGWISSDIPIGLTGLKKINLTADVQTGKNVLGAGGGGIYFYFNDYVDLLTGPVFFTDKALQPGGKKMTWTLQLDIDIPLKKAPKTP